MYPYKAMFKMPLSCTANAKKLQVTSELYYKDDRGNMQSTLLAAAGGIQPNQGLLKHHVHALQSCKFDMIGCIQGDILQEHYLLNEVGIKLKLVNSKGTFCLMGAPDNAKFHVTHAVLFMHKVKQSSYHYRCSLHILRWWKMARQNIP